MLFQTQTFILLFLPAALAAYYLAAANDRARQWVLVVASLVFYGWWDARFVPLLLGQITATWLLALWADRIGRRWPLVVAIVLNLASLGTFKYLDFAIGSLEAALGITLPRSGIVLPIGISFFSFQLVAYCADRLRGQVPLYGWRPFALVVLLFPHLIAGPIVRHSELAAQFDLDPRREGLAARFGIGMVLFTVGFAKKVLIADRLAPVADPLYLDATNRLLTFGEAWTAALAFSFQLFLDFSAYTEMAIGTALMFGLLLPENFRRPYLATNLRDFWRRWHISLSNFIRDYLYIPLGGSRGGWRVYVFATIASMAICGLWHGAGWTFVAWGVLHGVGLVVCRAWQTFGRPLPAVVGWALTMLFVVVGWVLFRAHDFASAGGILWSMAGGNGIAGVLGSAWLLAIAAAASLLIPSAYEMKDRLLRPHPVLAIATALVAVVCVLEVGRGQPVAFIYFQF